MKATFEAAILGLPVTLSVNLGIVEQTDVELENSVGNPRLRQVFYVFYVLTMIERRIEPI